MMRYFKHKNFLLESGCNIENLTVAYHTFGKINIERSNVVWVFHGLSANSNVLEWWPGLFGKNCHFDPSHDFIICANMLASPYGSTRIDKIDHPTITIRDIARSQILLAQHLGIKKIKTLIGGSCGGSQAFEFAIAYKGEVTQMIIIAALAKETPWAIAIHETQRMALKSDLTKSSDKNALNGIKLARAIGMLSYRTAESFNEKQQDIFEGKAGRKVISYLRYQGEKFQSRFDSLSYYHLTKCLDTHDVGRERGGLNHVLSKLKIKTLLIAIESDLLIPKKSMYKIKTMMPQANYTEIDSLYGHDGFLIETNKISNSIKQFEQI